MTQSALSAALHIPIQRVNELIKGKRGMAPETAILLGRFFETTADIALMPHEGGADCGHLDLGEGTLPNQEPVVDRRSDVPRREPGARAEKREALKPRPTT
jgi:hypothetical protein